MRLRTMVALTLLDAPLIALMQDVGWTRWWRIAALVSVNLGVWLVARFEATGSGAEAP